MDLALYERALLPLLWSNRCERRVYIAVIGECISGSFLILVCIYIYILGVILGIQER